MESRLDRLEEKLDKLVDEMQKQNVTMVKIQESLDYHIRRTDILENEFKPVHKHVSFVNNILRFLGAVGAALMMFKGVLELIKLM